MPHLTITSSNPSCINQSQHRQSCQRWIIAHHAFVSRLFMLLAMCLSCSILPDFHPGDDVLQFELRLLTPSSSPSQEKGYEHCFCLMGHGCDPYWESRSRFEGDSSCADSSSVRYNENDHHGESNEARYPWLDRFYAFILPPVTKWDAARFLTLSVDPWARYPSHHLRLKKGGSNDSHAGGETCNGDDETCAVQPENNDDDKRFFGSSEQAHAFLPLLPLVIRYTANFVMKIVPSSILPPTYEATAALSAIVINMIAFSLATISLYDLTIFMLKKEALQRIQNATKNGDGDHGSKRTPLNESSHHALAKTAAQLFCINPAGVFFTAVYSESLFAMLTFAGHAIAARGQYWNYYLQNENTERGAQKGQRGCWLLAHLYWIPSTILWMLASFTRSNGTFSSIWWMLFGLAKCCSCILSIKREGTTNVMVKGLTMLLCHAILASLVAYPVLYHDWRGYNFHCQNLPQMSAVQKQRLDSQLASHYPAWCENNGNAKRFSLYAHVQRKYWNVGLFRYYEMKQIPNFILALPVLALSFSAALMWIGLSWDRHINREIQTSTSGDGPSRGICTFLPSKYVFRWAFFALGGSSSCDPVPFRQQETEGKCYSSDTTPLPADLLGPTFLSHYAIVAGFALVGAFFAHVQISTRLICSSCPAFYWFVSSLLLSSRTNGRIDGNGKCGNGSIYGYAFFSVPTLLYFYFTLYNCLGSIMHVNWLPWT